jgi:hypothetical protein
MCVGMVASLDQLLLKALDLLGPYDKYATRLSDICHRYTHGKEAELCWADGFRQLDVLWASAKELAERLVGEL